MYLISSKSSNFYLVYVRSMEIIYFLDLKVPIKYPLNNCENTIKTVTYLKISINDNKI